MTHDDLQKIKVMPLRDLILNFSASRPHTGINTATVAFRLLESDSTLVLSPIRRQTHRGAFKTVAYKLEVSAFVSQNNFNEYTADLDNISRGELQNIKCVLQPESGQPAGAKMVLAFDRTIAHRTFWASWEIEQVEFRPRLNVKVGGLFSIDLLSQNTTQGVFVPQLQEVDVLELGGEYPDGNQ